MPPKPPTLDTVSRDAVKAQKMTVLLGVAVAVAVFTCAVTVIRQEFAMEEWRAEAAGFKRTMEEIREQLQAVQDRQHLQSMALQRIGGMLKTHFENDNRRVHGRRPDEEALPNDGG
eukprot:Sspe_Gene.752::Locus_251_Transcript_1_1_Confidence_1.000_Length_494::g.752::m.752